MQDEDLMSLCKRRGIIYPSFEIYGGLSGFYDYGPIGVRLKKNMEDLIRRLYIVEQDCMEVECNTLHPIDVFEASGHLESFTDLVVECVKCDKSYRADHLIQEETGINVEGKPKGEVEKYLKDLSCPSCGSGLGEPFEYNLMFETAVGPGKSTVTSYLRPETAQSTYLSFNRLWEYARKKLPFGVLQIGRSFRNEISPRQGMVRLREFNQAEIQFFHDPHNLEVTGFDEVTDMDVEIKDGEGNHHETTIGEAYGGLMQYQPIAYHLAKALELFKRMGIDEEKLRLRQHGQDERSFYSKDTWDVEYESINYGMIELVGVAYRTDYDLNQHMQASNQKMKITHEGEKFIPHVVEVAYGIDRPIYCLLESSRDERGFSFPDAVAPYLAGVFPLVKKDGLAEKARQVYSNLVDEGLYVFYDRGGSIGKRYARADEVGVPYCITIDYDTMEDDTVTVRYRDSKEQDRFKIKELEEVLRKNRD